MVNFFKSLISNFLKIITVEMGNFSPNRLNMCLKPQINYNLFQED